MSIETILLIVAFACFCAAAVNRNLPRINLLALGLACWVAAALLGAVGLLVVLLIALVVIVVALVLP